MNKMSGLFFLLLLFGSLFLLPAQTADRTAELERQLNRLESKIREARQLARVMNDPDIDKVVRLAETEYDLARQTFQNREYLETASHIKHSYIYLTQLYQNLKLTSDFRRKFSERLQQKIREAEELVSRTPNADAEKLLNRARYFRERAVLMLENDRPEAVFRCYFVALFFAENAIKLASGSDFRDSGEFKRYLDDSKSLLRQVEELAGSGHDPTIDRILRRATTELRNVQKLYDQKLYRQAFMRLQIVNRFLYRALDLLESSPSAVNERLEFDLNMLDDRISDVREEVRQSNNQELQKICERLVFIAADAHEKFRNSNFNGSRLQFSVANKLLYQLHKRLNLVSATPDKQLEEQLQTAGIMLNALQNNQGPSPLYSGLLELLERNYEIAQQDFRKGDFSIAWQHLRFFNQLALKLNQLQSSEKNNLQSEATARAGMNRLKTMLDKHSREVGTSTISIINYENADRLYDLASQSCNEGKYLQCEQIIRLAIDVLTQ